MITSFSVENYRAFAREQKIEIRPITLFFGWNSGGKSALIRFLPLLVESIKANGPPIWLAGDVGRESTWPELVSKATKRSILKFGIGGQNRNANFSIRWEIDGDLSGKWQQKRSISYEEVDIASGGKSISFAIDGSDSHVPIEWQGYADAIRTDNGNHLNANNNLNERIKASLIPLLLDTQWVSGIRVRPDRLVSYCGGNSPLLKSDGSNAANHLIQAKLRSNSDPVLQATGAFFSALGEELVLDNPMDGAWRVMLRPVSSPELKVNLCDTGEGYAQVLPVLVALARARNGGPKLLCLEQPELHLHTRAQAELAKALVDTVNSSYSPKILLETHSEVLLTSIQLAIANGEIHHDMVRVYWVESQSNGTSDVYPVDFNDKGQPNNLALHDAFSEAVDLGRRLMQKQIKGLQQ